MIFENKRTIDFREIRRTLWRRKLLLVIPPIVAGAAAVGGIMTTDPSYDSVATLQIESPVTLTRTVEAATGTRGKGSRYAIQTIRKKMLSTTFLESVAVQVGLHESPIRIARAQELARETGLDPQELLMRECVQSLQRMIEIQADGSDLFTIRAVSSSPEMAHRVAETVAEQFMQSSRQGKLQQSEEAYRFARDQMAIYEKELAAKRQKLKEYEQELAIRPLSRSPVGQANVKRVHSLIAAAAQDIEDLGERRDASRSRVREAGLSAFAGLDVAASPRLAALEETLGELERSLALSLVDGGNESAEAGTVRTQMAIKSQQYLSELESVLASQFPSASREDVRALVELEFSEVTLEGAKRRQRELQGLLDGYAADLASVPAAEFRLSRLREDVDSADRLYQTWVEQANSTQIAKAVQSASVGDLISMIERPRRPLAPFAPRKGRILALAVMMGVVIGFGAAVVSEYLDLTLKSVSEIEKVLGVPILGAVPKMQAAVLMEMETKRRRRVRAITISGLTTVLALAAIAAYYFLGPIGGGF